MLVDKYHSTSDGKRFILYVPSGMNIRGVKLIAEHSDLANASFKLDTPQMDMQQGKAYIIADPNEVLNQIGLNGYAIIPLGYETKLQP